MFALRVSRFVCFFGLIVAMSHSPAAGDEKTDKKEEKKFEIQVGDPAPGFEARSDADATWESSGRFGKKWVVVYFYPGDFTPGCMA